MLNSKHFPYYFQTFKSTLTATLLLALVLTNLSNVSTKAQWWNPFNNNNPAQTDFSNQPCYSNNAQTGEVIEVECENTNTENSTEPQTYFNNSCNVLKLQDGYAWINTDKNQQFLGFKFYDDYVLTMNKTATLETPLNINMKCSVDEYNNIYISGNSNLVGIFKIENDKLYIKLQKENNSTPIQFDSETKILEIREFDETKPVSQLDTNDSTTNPTGTQTPAPETYFENYSCQLELPEGQMWKNINSKSTSYGFNFRPNGISNIVYKTDESTFLTKNIEYLTGQINQNGSTDIDITDIGLGKTLKTIYQITSDCKLEIEIISVKFTDETRPKQITQEGKRVYEVVTESF